MCSLCFSISVGKSPGGSDSPSRESEGSSIRNQEEKLFFLQKVFLFESFHWKLSNSLFKNAPSGKRVPSVATDGQRALPSGLLRFFEKNRVKLLRRGAASANLQPFPRGITFATDKFLFRKTNPRIGCGHCPPPLESVSHGEAK